MAAHRYHCQNCQKAFQRAQNRNLHARQCRYRSALGGSVRQGSINVQPTTIDYNLVKYANRITRSVLRFLHEHGALKVLLTAVVIFHQVVGEVETVTEPGVAFHAEKPVIVLSQHGLRHKVLQMLRQIELKIENFQELGSGWTFKRLVKLFVDTVIFKPISGATFVPTPVRLVRKKALINIKSKDMKCFKYAILAALYRDRLSKNPNRQVEYAKLDGLVDFSGLPWPMNLGKITEFERRNPTIGVNVFAYNRGEVGPLRLCNASATKFVDLLLLCKKEKRHFVAITNLERLLHGQMNKKGHSRVICRRCLNTFYTRKQLEAHNLACHQRRMGRIILPSWFYYTFT
jgi:hypothetical protein